MLALMHVHPPTGQRSGPKSTGRAVSENVRRLQMRIVKATQGGRRNKVKVLQRLLTSSFFGKVLAVKRVTENKGKGQQELTGNYGQPLKANLRQYKTLTGVVINLFR